MQSRGQPPEGKTETRGEWFQMGERMSNQHNMETKTTVTEQKSQIQHTIPFPGTRS